MVTSSSLCGCHGKLRHFHPLRSRPPYCTRASCGARIRKSASVISMPNQGGLVENCKHPSGFHIAAAEAISRDPAPRDEMASCGLARFLDFFFFFGFCHSLDLKWQGTRENGAPNPCPTASSSTHDTRLPLLFFLFDYWYCDRDVRPSVATTLSRVIASLAWLCHWWTSRRPHMPQPRFTPLSLDYSESPCLDRHGLSNGYAAHSVLQGRRSCCVCARMNIFPPFREICRFPLIPILQPGLF